MTDFLLLLGKLNLAMGGAIALVWLLRRPLRTQFGAPIAYALWLLVPIAGLACLLPPRVAAPLPVHVAAVQIPVAPMIAQIARPAPPAVERMPEKSATSPSVRPVIAAPATDFVMPEYATLLFAAWVLGVGAMTFYLARLQARFHAAARLGEAGPAVAGFFRPRIVIPSGFAEQFNAAEQAAILAHERAHLARQDARINALAALLRCLCWFNPLVQLGAGWLRIDQELACDAAAMSGHVSRRDYANALLKSQMTLTPLPLGCDWPGSEHPLTERIALLKRKQPGPGRRIAGVGLVLFAAAFAGFGAWAAQPAVPGKAIEPLHNQIALMAAIPNQVAAPATASIPVDVPKPAPVIKPVSAVPVIAPAAVAPQIQPVVTNQPKTATTPDVQLALTTVETPVTTAAPAPSAAAASAIQPAAPALSAAPFQVAALAPTSNPVSPTQTPSPGLCPSTKEAVGVVPEIIPGPFDDHLRVLKGTIISVHADPQLPGTDIVLGNREDDNEWIRGRDVLVVLIPVGNVKDFPALGSYVGQKVCIFASAGTSEPMFGKSAGLLEITNPRQLYPLPTTAAIRPEIAQHLARVLPLNDHGFSLGAMKQVEAAEAVPNQSDEEKTAVAEAKATLLGNRPVADNYPVSQYSHWMSGPQQSLGNEALPPGDQIQCPNCGIGTPKAN